MKSARRMAIVGLALPFSLMAQEGARLDTTVRLNLGATVDLSLLAGTITVRGWEQPGVRVVASTQNGSLRFDATPNRIILRVEREAKAPHARGPATYDVSVPRGTRLRVEAGSASTTVTGSQGEISATSVGGPISVSDGRRQVALESLSGLITASEISGDLRAQNVSGSIRTRDVSGRLEAWAVNGGISMTGGRSNDIRAETVGGDIIYSGPAATGGTYDFESHSGAIRVSIPPSPGAVVRVETVSGGVHTDYPIRTASASRGGKTRRAKFTLGAGRANVTARTFSGGVWVRTVANPTIPMVSPSVVRSDSVPKTRRDSAFRSRRDSIAARQKDSVRTIRR